MNTHAHAETSDDDLHSPFRGLLIAIGIGLALWAIILRLLDFLISLAVALTLAALVGIGFAQVLDWIDRGVR